MASEAFHASQMIDGLDKRDILREIRAVRADIAELKAMLQGGRQPNWERRSG